MLADLGGGLAGVLPGGAGAGVAGDALGRHAEIQEPLGGWGRVAGDVDAVHAAFGEQACGEGGGGGAAAAGWLARR